MSEQTEVRILPNPTTCAVRAHGLVDASRGREAPLERIVLLLEAQVWATLANHPRPESDRLVARLGRGKTNHQEADG